MEFLLKEYQFLYNQSEDMLLSVDPASGKIVKCNRAFSDRTGFTEEEISDLFIYQIVTDANPAQQLSLYHEYIAHKKITNKELSIKKRNGGSLTVVVSAVSLRDETGNIGRVLIMLRPSENNHSSAKPNTGIEKKNGELEAAYKELIEKNRQLEEFAYIISHNLHSHIVNLNSLLSFYVKSEDHNEKEELVGKLKNITQHLLRTFEELSDTMLIRTKEETVTKELFFDDIFQKTLDVLSGQIMEAGVEITADFYDCQKVRYHQPYLESIMLNLISNAIKYRSPNRKPYIHVKSYCTDGEDILEVTDNGLGIDLNKYGDKMFKLHKIFHEHEDARGVGLFLTKNQVEAMGGSISVQSEVDKGTTFTIVLKKKHQPKQLQN